MNEFLEEASRLRAYLDDWVQLFELPIKVFEEAGMEGILQMNEGWVTRKNSAFADHITAHAANVPTAAHVPEDVIKAMCIGAANLMVSQKAHAKGDPFALFCLIRAAEKLGFCIGAAFGCERFSVSAYSRCRHPADRIPRLSTVASLNFL